MARKSKPTPSFEERLNASQAQAAAAASVFEAVALDLKVAASDKRQIADDIAVEIDRLEGLMLQLESLQYEALDAAEAADAKADNIYALMGN